MAITQVAPVATQGQTTTKRTPSKTARGLERVIGGIGAVAGGLTGAAPGILTGNVPGAVAGGTAGALGGFSAGRNLGNFIGEGVDPTRSEQIASPTPQIPQQLQGYKFSHNGMTILDALAAADTLGPDFAEHKEPLVLALMQDISSNNSGGQV